MSRFRLAAMMLAAVALAGGAAMATSSPASADEPSAFCYNYVSGTITAPASAPFGSWITVQTNVTPCDNTVALEVTGPGFESNPWVGYRDSRSMFAVPPDISNPTMSWTLWVCGFQQDNPGCRPLASTSMTVSH
jgi:hypothetical protein